MKTRGGLLALGIVLALAMVGGRARADNNNGSQTFHYLAGENGFGVDLCSPPPPHACPDATKASNGDTIEVAGTGTFVVGEEDSITGGGTFTHKNAAGAVIATGTWAAEELVSFVSFGPDPSGALPPNFLGGQVVMEVELSPTGSGEHLDAVLTVDCNINSPTGAADGAILVVEDGLTFNQKIPPSFTVFLPAD